MRSGDVCSDESPLALLQAGLAGLAGTDVAGLPARWLGTFDTRNLCDQDAVRTTLSWLRIYGRMTDTAASSTLRRTRLLRDLPALAAAAAAGTVSVEHLTPILRLVKQFGIAAVRDFDEVLAEVAT